MSKRHPRDEINDIAQTGNSSSHDSRVWIDHGLGREPPVGPRGRSAIQDVQVRVMECESTRLLDGFLHEGGGLLPSSIAALRRQLS
jgi:hypothetical protein